MINNIVKKALDKRGIIKPLIIPSEYTGGTGLMNPSIYVHEGRIWVNLRHVNYTLYHSEKKVFEHPFGPLTYLHPENDIHLRTWNWICELDANLDIKSFNKVDTSLFDTYEPKWDFIGLEDARIFRWNDRWMISGVRRDTTTNGQGRMEISVLEGVEEGEPREVNRVRIEPPNDPNSYCEKNWMPILDRPYQYIKWSNPTELVEVYPNTNSSKTLHMSNTINLPRDLRGGSQVIPYKDGYIAITHEVWLFNSEVGRKDAKYYHRVIYWDSEFNIIKTSDDFNFMGADIEFCVGLSQYKDSFLITFGFQDNAAYVLKASTKLIDELLGL